ncbi:MAG: hypothetical protein AAF682_06765 [Planctomycetota bacterium]
MFKSSAKLSRARRAALPSLLLASLALSGCSTIEDIFGWDSSSGGGVKKLKPRSAKYAVLLETPIVQKGDLIVYLASEATSGEGGTDLNKDGDFADVVASVINMKGGETLLRAATIRAEIAVNQVYLLVDEDEDSKDWNGDGAFGDVVLLHWKKGQKKPKYVATPDFTIDEPILATDGGLYYIDAPGALTAPDTTLNFLPTSMPTTPIRLTNDDPTFTLDPRFHRTDEGLLFLRQDETVEGRDLNGDGDTFDEAVLALHDSSDPASPIRNVALAMSGPAAPIRALNLDVGDWLVGFTVNEPAQGSVNFNDVALFDPAWNPPHCPPQGDLDATDNILFFLRFNDWATDPVTSPPVNTGLVAALRILAIAGEGGSPGFIATLSPEGEFGDPCNFNGDDDLSDVVLRWTEAQEPIVPFGVVDDMIAGASPTGGTQGAAVLDGRFVIVASESTDERDHDGDGMLNHDLVAWLDPRDGQLATYTFDHSAGGGFYAGTDWMAESQNGERLLVALREDIVGISLNSGDEDLNDTVATFVRFSEDNPQDMDFPGPPVAITDGNPELTPDMVLANGMVLYRVDEGADGVNWDGAGGLNDTVLLATPLNNLQKTQFVAKLTTSVSPAIYADGNTGAAYIVRENTVNEDLNKDGDKLDFVVRWFRL